LLLAAGWLAASIMILWGGALWIQHGLMEADVVGMAESMDATSTRWQLVLWNPFGWSPVYSSWAQRDTFQTQGRVSEVQHQPRTGVSTGE
jgi:hypothetical protein